MREFLHLPVPALSEAKRGLHSELAETRRQLAGTAEATLSRA
jgi:hypothetical protein